MTLTGGWLLPPTPIRGLDHLGVQAPCIALYAQLLPGITNVTDRARYYSFYPWFLWSFDQRATDRSEESFVRELRRAECLLTLIANRHCQVSGEPQVLHDSAMTGNQKLGPAVRALEAGAALDLESFAAFEGDRRYFKSKWGGFGQYYWGSLRDLRIVDSTPSGVPGYDQTRGVALARAFEGGVSSDAFFEVLARGSVSLDELDRLSPFCPCGLRANAPELEALLDVFLARTAEYLEDGGDARRESLALLLSIADASGDGVDEWRLRVAAYSGCLLSGQTWELPARLQAICSRWAIYERNELLSIAIQGLFWAVLQAIDVHRRGRLRGVAEAGDVLVALAAETDWVGRLDGTVAAAVDQVASSLPARGSWDDERHEERLATKVQEIAGRFDCQAADLPGVVDRALSILAALMIRQAAEADGYPYAGFDFAADHFGGTEIDLASFRVQSPRWRGLTVRHWLSWLATTWGVERHLRVALRKLRAQSQDTFRIRPLDDRLQVVEVAPAGFTGPRVRQALQILLDLGLLTRTETGAMVSSQRGRAELEKILG
ncbi:MAG: hypothetical protein IT379_38040 [Deltaproteobacteria bacterium]|nr:hypothetical protein [Deltaproteobacteria bacterium]